MKMGLFFPRMQSDLWETNLENLTLSRPDMVNAYYGGEYEFYFHRHASFSLEVGSYARSYYAQYRDYTFQDGSPVFQNVSLRIVPIEANLKLYPLGHRTRFFPFIGAGAGVYAWTYQQWGSFINFEDDSINDGFAETRRFAFGLNGRFGLVFRFHSRLGIALEGKYQHLRGRLSEFFQGFEPLDLGGFSANASINLFLR
ncbi:MAG: hypothetical protein MUC72_01200 [Acidobacteria bacterium]|jgi:hypothetical protein|nr:hypothetical protein [Acidobacteriota bacterium]